MDATTLSPHEKLLKLEELVQEKDQLLSILSERLEQAVEQLDRIRREGPEATLEMPQPVVETSNSLNGDLRDDLRKMLDDWQDLQRRSWFDQLNDRLDLIQDLFAKGAPGSDATAHGTIAEPPKTASQKEESSTYTSSVADILARYGRETEQAAAASEKAADSTPVSSGETVMNAFGLTRSDRDTISERMPLPLPPSPESVDFETADLATLRAAVAARDAYITQLEEYLKTMESTAQQPIDFPSLESLSDKQQQVLENWSDSIRKEFRQTQIQISLERAQLSRESMKLQHRQQMVDSELKRLEMARRAGLIGPEEDALDGPKSSSRSWMGIFGSK